MAAPKKSKKNLVLVNHEAYIATMRQSLGGYARAAKLTPEKRSEIARIAAKTRWNRKPSAMRNLVKYPVTTNEIEQCLKTLAAEFAKEEIPGDMRAVLLRKAAVIVARAVFVLHDVQE